MWILRRLIPPSQGPATETTPAPDVERAVERVSDDETLRGDLTDDGFGPLFALTANLAVARGDRFSTTDDLAAALRHLLVNAVEAAQQADRASLVEAAVPPLIAPEEQSTLAERLGELSGLPDENAGAIARALAAATGVEAPEEPAT